MRKFASLGAMGLVTIDELLAHKFENGNLCSALDQDEFDLNASGSKGGAKLSLYSTADAKATVEASGYFDALEANIDTGDFILYYSSAATGGGAALMQMVNTAGVITEGLQIALA